MKPGWEVKTLGEVADFQGGGQPPKSEFIFEPRDGYVRMLQIRDFKSDDKAVYIPITNRTNACTEDDIMIGRYGASVGQIHRGKAGAYNVALIKTIPDVSLIDRDYLYHFLTSELFQQPLVTVADRSAQAGFSKQDIAPFPIPLPPLDEQKRIVEVLDAAFEGLSRARAHTETNLQNARELFEQSLDEVLSTQSSDWCETTLGEIYDVRDGTHDSPAYVESGHALVTSKNLGRDGLHFEKVKFISNEDFLSISKRSAVHTGDVLFAMIGTIGNPIVVEIEPSFAIKNVALFKMKDGRNGHFLRYFLTSKRTVEKMMAEAKGTTQQFVGLGYLRSFPIRAPSPDEEGVFVAKFWMLEELSQQLETHYRAKLADLDALRQSLLQKAFAGELT